MNVHTVPTSRYGSAIISCYRYTGVEHFLRFFPSLTRNDEKPRLLSLVLEALPTSIPGIHGSSGSTVIGNISTYPFGLCELQTRTRGGTIANRTFGKHKNLYQVPVYTFQFLLGMFGPI